MEVNNDISKRIEELEKENKELRDKIEKLKFESCKKLLRMATEDIRKLLCEEYGSTCQFCIQEGNKDAMCAKIGGSGGWCCENAEWKHANKVKAILEK